MTAIFCVQCDDSSILVRDRDTNAYYPAQTTYFSTASVIGITLLAIISTHLLEGLCYLVYKKFGFRLPVIRRYVFELRWTSKI